MTGRIVCPSDVGYATDSAGGNLLFSYRPRVVVFAQVTQDVVNALAWARQHLSRSGCAAEGIVSKVGRSVDDGIVIDVAR